jgi:hypothetical protein
MAQLKVPSVGVVTTSEKYTLTHSRHTGVCQSDSEEVQTEPLGVPLMIKTMFFHVLPNYT